MIPRPEPTMADAIRLEAEAMIHRLAASRIDGYPAWRTTRRHPLAEAHLRVADWQRRWAGTIRLLVLQRPGLWVDRGPDIRRTAEALARQFELGAEVAAESKRVWSGLRVTGHGPHAAAEPARSGV